LNEKKEHQLSTGSLLSNYYQCSAELSESVFLNDAVNSISAAIINYVMENEFCRYDLAKSFSECEKIKKI
jgi:hypothetical protein